MYAAINKATAAKLAAGQQVVVDAVFAKGAKRAASAQTPTSNGSRSTGIWLVASDPKRCSRVSERTADASDADTTVALARANVDPGCLDDWITLSANRPLNVVVAAAAAILRRDEI